MTVPAHGKAARGRPFATDARTRIASGASALRELLATPRLVQAHFLALDFARVAGHEPGLRQRRFQLRVVLDQRPRDAVAHCAGLTRLPAADDVDHDVERLLVV